MAAHAYLCFGGGLFACSLELFMAGQDHDFRLVWPIAEREQDLTGLEHSCVSATYRIYDLHACIVHVVHALYSCYASHV